MKKLFKTLAVLVAVAALGFGFVSCGGDDDSTSNGNNTDNSGSREPPSVTITNLAATWDNCEILQFPAR